MLPLALSACASIKANREASYSSTARENYERGMKELKQENWIDALRYFQYTRAKYGFSKWATLSELALCDADLGREKHQEAIDCYKNFIKNHPTHPQVQDGYAAFQIGESFYKQIPGDFFLFPPSYEKDQGPVRDATRELAAFIEENPDSKYLAQARKKLAECQRRLAEHELYVANFYLDRGKPQAAVSRLDGLLREYPRSSIEPSVLLLLGRTYLKMDRPAEARRVLERLTVSFPQDPSAQQGRLYLRHIAERYGARALAPPPAPPPKTGEDAAREAPAAAGGAAP